MKKVMTLAILIALALSFTGCASYLSYQSSQRELVGQRVIASGDEVAIKSYRSGDMVGLGVDVFATEVLTKHPLRQLGAALLDAGLAYGAYEGIKALDVQSSHSRSSDVDTGGNDNTVIVIDDSQNVTITVPTDSQNTTDN